jgi:hypothetical protein
MSPPAGVFFHEDVSLLLTQGSAINVRLFEKRELAAEWLGVPVALLEKQVG